VEQRAQASEVRTGTREQRSKLQEATKSVDEKRVQGFDNTGRRRHRRAPHQRRRGLMKHMTMKLAGVATALWALASAAPAPAAPVTLNIVDVAGQLVVTQSAIESFRDKHPELVSKITFTKATAPELPGKLKAMQAAGRSDIDLVLTGTDALAAGIQQGLWEPIFPQHASSFPGFPGYLIPGAAKMQDLASNQGVIVIYSPAGPLIQYNPDKVKNPPTTAAELLAWCKANPNRLIYARPANSGPGRTFLMGLPYILGDKDPKDPEHGWDKTWAYLQQLNECVEYYPTGTGAVMKEFGEGSRDMTVTMTGWDLNPRIMGVVPKATRVTPIKGMTWVNDAQYMAIPKGVPADRMAVLLQLMSYMMTPEAQATTYDKGYFYPGPARDNVPLSMAPKESQQLIGEFGRPEYAQWLKEFPQTQSLPPDAQVKAFAIWDDKVGAKIKK
jgi:putative spermidine/putrescine transport system substrate-binding protein